MVAPLAGGIMRIALLLFDLVLAGTLAGCGGTHFSAAGAAGTGAGGDPANSGAAGNGPTNCSPLPSNAPDVYVDQRFTDGTPTGTQQCPFTTILDGMNAPAAAGTRRTVHVAGDSPALIYQETTRVIVNPGMTLQGDGIERVKVSAAGACAGKTCAIHVQAGGVVEGMTVTCPQGNGIVTGVLGTAAAPPTIRNAAASDSAMNGIVAQGDVELGPAIRASRNGLPGKGHGVSAEGAGLVRVRAGNGAANQFNGNGWHGINVAAGALLQFEGGEALGNGNNGIRLDQQCAPPPAVHQVTALTATGNPNNGLAAYGGSLRLRSSRLLGNGRNGLSFGYPAGTELDIGTLQDPGGNVFGGQTPATNNTEAGILLCNARAAEVDQAAEGNQWSACPPSLGAAGTCSTAPSSYADIWYGSVNLSVSTCELGP
jgi:hypothetical protein